jgi:hypothetical protein
MNNIVQQLLHGIHMVLGSVSNLKMYIQKLSHFIENSTFLDFHILRDLGINPQWVHSRLWKTV